MVARLKVAFVLKYKKEKNEWPWHCALHARCEATPMAWLSRCRRLPTNPVHTTKGKKSSSSQPFPSKNVKSEERFSKRCLYLGEVVIAQVNVGEMADHRGLLERMHCLAFFCRREAEHASRNCLGMTWRMEVRRRLNILPLQLTRCTSDNEIKCFAHSCFFTDYAEVKNVHQKALQEIEEC